MESDRRLWYRANGLAPERGTVDVGRLARLTAPLSLPKAFVAQHGAVNYDPAILAAEFRRRGYLEPVEGLSAFDSRVSLHISDYETLCWERIMRGHCAGPALLLRRALIRKANLWECTQRHVRRNPGTPLQGCVLAPGHAPVARPPALGRFPAPIPARRAPAPSFLPFPARAAGGSRLEAPWQGPRLTPTNVQY